MWLILPNDVGGFVLGGLMGHLGHQGQMGTRMRRDQKAFFSVPIRILRRFALFVEFFLHFSGKAGEEIFVSCVILSETINFLTTGEIR